MYSLSHDSRLCIGFPMILYFQSLVGQVSDDASRERFKQRHIPEHVQVLQDCLLYLVVHSRTRICGR